MRDKVVDGGFEAFLDRAFSSLECESYKDHPSRQMLLDYIYEQVDGNALSRISAHVATCGECSRYVRALQDELDELDRALASYLRGTEVGVRTIAKERWRRVGRKFKRLLQSPWLSSRRAFYGHLAAYAGASAAVVLLLLGHLQRPAIVWEGSEGPTTGAFVLNLLYGVIAALGLWGATGLTLHGYKALKGKVGQGRDERGDRDKGD